MLEQESASLRYHVYQVLNKTENFEFFGPNLPKNGFSGRNFKKSISGFGIRIFDILCTPFFRQNGQL